MLIGEVITEIIKQVGADPDDPIIREKMLLCLKSSLRKFPLYARTRAIIDTAHATLSAGDDYINPLPVDFFEEKAVYYKDNDEKRFVEINEGRFLQDGAKSVGLPQFCRILGETLEFNCKSDRDLVIYIEYYKVIDAIDEEDTWAFDSNMLEVAKEGCKYYYLSDYTEDQARGREKLALFNDGLDRIEEREMMRRVGGHIGD